MPALMETHFEAHFTVLQTFTNKPSKLSLSLLTFNKLLHVSMLFLAYVLM